MSTIQHNDRDTFFFIAHTHWEGAVFKTRAAYLDMGLPNILRALELLKTHPNYRFVLDQACYVQPFLERYPQEAATFQRFVDEGRLAIAGGTDVMLDVNMPGGESFVRQAQYGKDYFRRALGVDVTIGWPLDTFGHHPQIPQLYKLAGLKSFWFFRGVPDWDTPAEFLWEGIDGTRLPAFWLPHGYAVTFFSPQTLPEFADFMKKQWDLLAPFARAPGRVGLAGADVCEPEAHVPELVEAFNRQPDAPFTLRIATPAEYEAWVAARGGLPVLKADLNPIFQGSYSSRIKLKQQTRELERLLTTAEKLAVIRGWLGLPVDAGLLWRAWEPMLFNQTHDLMSGVMTDHVYADTLASNDFSKRIAEPEVEAGLRDLAARVDTRGEGVPIVVFNPSGWARTDIVQVDVGFTQPGLADVALVDPEGRPAPVQLLDAQRHADGALLHARAAFVARDVPALGHAVYRLVPAAPAVPEAAAPAPDGAAPDGAAIETAFYRVEFDPAGGAITRLFVKDGGWDALSGPGNVVVQEADHGDLWEPYKPLDGGSRIAMTTPHPAAPRGQAVYSDEQPGLPGQIARGPVYSEFSVSHPFSADGRFDTTVRVYAELRRIDIRTRILNTDSFVRYRAVFPAAVRGGAVTREIPFGAVAQPEGIEFPAQNWLDYGDGARGLALLNRGLPGNNVADGVMMLSLLRSTRIVAYGFGGGYEPGMSSDTGLELGQEFTLDYALAPHAGDWRQAAVYQDGQAFNQPLLAVAAAPHPGPLPARWGFLEINHANVAVSALKPGRDGAAVLRVYEAAGQPAEDVVIRLPAKVKAAEEVNLLEDPGVPLVAEGDTLRISLSPFEIKTLSLRM